MSNNLTKKLVKWSAEKQQRRRVTLSAEEDQLSWKFEILANRAKSYGETHGNRFSLLDHTSKYTAILTASLRQTLCDVYTTISNTNIQCRNAEQEPTETFKIQLGEELYPLTRLNWQTRTLLLRKSIFLKNVYMSKVSENLHARGKLSVEKFAFFYLCCKKIKSQCVLALEKG